MRLTYSMGRFTATCGRPHSPRKDASRGAWLRRKGGFPPLQGEVAAQSADGRGAPAIRTARNRDRPPPPASCSSEIVSPAQSWSAGDRPKLEYPLPLQVTNANRHHGGGGTDPP